MNPRRPWHLTIALIGIGACIASCRHTPATSTTAEIMPVSREGMEVESVIGVDDPRRTMVGDWEYEITDARPCERFVMRECRGARLADAVSVVRGRLRISDTVFKQFPVRALGRSALPRFDLALGRSVSCTDPDWHVLRVEMRDSGAVDLRFTPWGADCGVSAELVRADDGFIGPWHENGFAGPGATGRLRLVRVQERSVPRNHPAAVSASTHQRIR